jgi:hypothetical protein
MAVNTHSSFYMKLTSSLSFKNSLETLLTENIFEIRNIRTCYFIKKKSHFFIVGFLSNKNNESINTNNFFYLSVYIFNTHLTRTKPPFKSINDSRILHPSPHSLLLFFLRSSPLILLAKFFT